MNNKEENTFIREILKAGYKVGCVNKKGIRAPLYRIAKKEIEQQRMQKKEKKFETTTIYETIL